MIRISFTPFEAIISGSIAELAELGARIGSISRGSSFAVAVGQGEGPVAKLVITENGASFLATRRPQVGLLIQGSQGALASFAEQFHFRGEPVAGMHNHWDMAGRFDFVDNGSLPIVVQVE